jgi:hypothetical protein
MINFGIETKVVMTFGKSVARGSIQGNLNVE